MTFLELCKDVARESGTLAGGVNLPSVTGVTGRAEKVVSWTRKAWTHIQMSRRGWLFMRAEFTAALAANVARYTGASLSLPRFGSWAEDGRDSMPYTLYDPARGAADEGPIEQIEFGDWKAYYDRGVVQPNRPIHYAISPAGEFCAGPTPDKAYVFRGEYRYAAQSLVANTDVPAMPEDYHGAIVWEALRLMANSDEAGDAAILAGNEYSIASQRLYRDQLPKIDFGWNALA